MRLRNTLAALLLALGLGAWIYFYEYRGEEGRETKESEAKKALVFETAAIAGIDLIRPEGAMRLRKEGETWRMTEPIEARADAEEVSGILSSLSWLEVDKRIPVEGGDWEPYKLKEPALTVVLKPAGGGADLSLSIGDKAPIGSSYYARRGADAEVVTIPASVDRVLEANADKLRYKKIVGLDSWSVAKFSVSRGGALVAFAKEGEEWRIESPAPFPADRGKISSLLYDLTGMSAEGFEPAGASAEAAGLVPPAVTLRVEPKEGAAVVVEVSEPGADGLARARRTDMPEIFRIKKETFERLALQPAEYRDLRVAPVDRWEVKEIRVLTADGEKVAVKDAESNWRWGAADGPTMAGRAVDDLLDALEAAKAASLVEGGAGAAGIGASPSLTLKLKAGERPPVEVRFGAEAEGMVLAASSASQALYRIEKSAAEKVLSLAGSLAEPKAEASGTAAVEAGGEPAKAGGTR